MFSVYPTRARTASALVAFALVLQQPRITQAHSTADIHIDIDVTDTQVDLRMLLELRDLRHLVAIDNNDDGRISRAEIAEVKSDLAQYLQRYLRVDVGPNAKPCEASLVGLQPRDFSSIKVHLRYLCPDNVDSIDLSSGLFAGTSHDYVLSVVATRQQSQQQTSLSRRHNRARIVFAKSTIQNYWYFSGIGLALTTLVLVLLWYWRRQEQAKGIPSR